MTTKAFTGATGTETVEFDTGARTAATQRVTIATDDLVPVSGSVTAALSATDNAVLDTIDAVLDTIDADTSALAAGGPTTYPGGAAFVHKDARITSAATTTLWDPTAGKKFALTRLTVSMGGTTGGLVTVVDNADGDGARIFEHDFPASATLHPGATISWALPGYISAAADNILKVITAAASTVYVSVDGYEI